MDHRDPKRSSSIKQLLSAPSTMTPGQGSVARDTRQSAWWTVAAGLESIAPKRWADVARLRNGQTSRDGTFLSWRRPGMAQGRVALRFQGHIRLERASGLSPEVAVALNGLPLIRNSRPNGVPTRVPSSALAGAARRPIGERHWRDPTLMEILSNRTPGTRSAQIKRPD
jgi:hypothetical protein